ncbi:MAG: oligoribonuclease [Pseudomonadota bacterium]
MTQAQTSGALIWIDLEMTGLDPETDRIIEIATLVTDRNLNEIAEGPVLAVHQPQPRLAAMDDWNRRTHGDSGLIERIRRDGVSVRDAERRTLEFLERHVEPGSSPMCGNSICQDRRFLARTMPRLEAYFHYRNLDVSTVKILAALWHGEVAAGFTKASAHQALSDIRDSVAELRHYRDHLFR